MQTVLRMIRTVLEVNADMYRTLSIENLAYRCWELRGRRYDGAPHDWGEAERLRRQLVEEAAYFRWLDRGERLWDSWRDWFAAEAEVLSGNR
jgi:hypothetical protein